MAKSDFMTVKNNSARREGYYRFQFRCGCEILTSGNLEHIENYTVSCIFHNETRYCLFALQEDRYWCLLLGDTDTLSWAELFYTIPSSRGIRAEDLGAARKNLDRECDELRTRWAREARDADPYRAGFEIVEDTAA
jgi:hypothetical protein